jgi:hypothetical protein
MKTFVYKSKEDLIEGVRISKKLKRKKWALYAIERPFKNLIITGICPQTQSNISQVTIKTNCISSYYGLIDLSQLQVNTQYTTFGSNYNHNKNFTIYNDNINNNTITKQSIYLSDDSYILNDSYNKFELTLSNLSNSFKFQNIKINDVSINIVSGTTIQIDASSNTSIQSQLSQIVTNSYLKIVSTSSINNYTGLYCINSIVNNSNLYTIIFNSKYERNDIIYTVPPAQDPFYNTSYPLTINNSYILLKVQL